MANKVEVFGWVKQPKLKQLNLEHLSPQKQALARAKLELWRKAVESNPLLDVYAPSQKHHNSWISKAYMVATFGGNRSAKTSSMVILCIINCIPWEWVPEHLRQYRTFMDDRPFQARICVPKLEFHAQGVILPLLRRWVPKDLLLGGSWDKAFSNKSMTVRFKNGSFIEFRSYDQDVSAHAGSTRDAIYFDEEPPKDIYEENRIRVAESKGGQLRFALTPLGLSWIFHDIYKHRNEVEPYNPDQPDSDDIECFTLSIHDNTTLSASGVAKALRGYTGAMREAREHGHFVAMSGRIYDTFSQRRVSDGGHIAPNITPAQLRGLDSGSVYIGIDPELRRPSAAFIHANHILGQVLMFDELRPVGMTTMNTGIFARLLKAKIAEWGIEGAQIFIDPAAMAADINTGQTILSEYHRHGVPAVVVKGSNAKDLGISRVQELITTHSFAVCERCTHVRDEFDVYSWDEDAALRGESKPKKTAYAPNVLDGVRYISMVLPWDSLQEDTTPKPPAGSVEEMVTVSDQQSAMEEEMLIDFLYS